MAEVSPNSPGRPSSPGGSNSPGSSSSPGSPDGPDSPDGPESPGSPGSSLNLLLRSRMALLALGAVFILVILVVVGFFLTQTGPAEQEAAEAALEIPAEPMLPESDLYRFVAATIEAYVPTPVPTVTPDIPATVAADLVVLQRQGAARIVDLDPLDRQEGRNPFLTDVEREHLESLGPSLWLNVRLWLHLRDLDRDTVPVPERPDLEEQTELLQENMDQQDTRQSDRLGDQVGDTVASFTDEYQLAVADLHKGANAVGRMHAINEEARAAEQPLTTEQLDELTLLEIDLREGITAFHDFMSGYGCSLCGELFRTVEP